MRIISSHPFNQLAHGNNGSSCPNVNTIFHLIQGPYLLFLKHLPRSSRVEGKSKGKQPDCPCCDIIASGYNFYLFCQLADQISRAAHTHLFSKYLQATAMMVIETQFPVTNLILHGWMDYFYFGTSPIRTSSRMDE